MIDKHELEQMLGKFLQECLCAEDFLSKREEVRRIGHMAGGTLDSYEEEGSYFDVRIATVNGWGNNALYSRKFPLQDIVLAAE